MTFFILSEFASEITISLAILIDLIFGATIISQAKWRRPILVKYSYRFYLVTLFIALAIYLSRLIMVDFSVGLHPALLLKFIATIAAIIVLIYSKAALKIQKISFSEFFFFYMVAVLSTLLMLDANDLLFFYLVLEAQTLSFFMLACANRYSLYPIEAALKYYISGSNMSAFFLLGTAIIYGCTGSVEIVEINTVLFFEGPFDHFMDSFLFFGVVCVTGSILFKIGSFPFHAWLPDVYEGSPLASTIVFSLLPKLSLIFFFVKYVGAIEISNDRLTIPFIVFGLLSVLVGTLFAMRQYRLKRLIAYSSIVQVGFMVIGLAGHSLSSYTAVLFFTFIYILTASLLWGVVILVYNYQIENSFDQEEYLHSIEVVGVSNYIITGTYMAFVLIVAVFAMAGIPPFINFTAKMLILKMLVNHKYFVSAFILLTSSSVSVFYYIRILKAVLFDNIKKNVDSYSDFKVDSINTTDNMLAIHFIVIILTCLTVFLFFCPHSLYSLSQDILLGTIKMFQTDIWTSWKWK